MIVTCKWDGKVLAFDLESITAREYKAIKRHTGLKFGEFWRAFSAATDDFASVDLEVIDSLVWLFLKRNGYDYADPEVIPDYSPLDFMGSFDVLADASKPEEPKDDPLVVPSTGAHELI